MTFWAWFLVATTALAVAAFCKSYRYWSAKHWELSCLADGRAKQLDKSQARESELDSRLDRRLLELADLSEKLQARDADLATARQTYAEAEAELATTQKALIDTEERLRFWMAMAEKLDARADKANADAIEAREIVADWVAQRTFGRSIFHKAPPLPEESRHKKPIPRARIQGRLAVQLADAAFAKQEAELRKRAAGPNPGSPAESATEMSVEPVTLL